jgi:hypothetical protein
MSRIIPRLGAMLVALTAVAGAIVISTQPANPTGEDARAIPAVCFDGFRLWRHYNSSGDDATASALLSNLYGMGCFD